ncbi:MAG TPA: hypothetical protein VJ729_12920 [Nitrososphaeraceae archaeon]|nr:hypothetical protein [Nitrososphaeraceae archaeon]
MSTLHKCSQNAYCIEDKECQGIKDLHKSMSSSLGGGNLNNSMFGGGVGNGHGRLSNQNSIV